MKRQLEIHTPDGLAKASLFRSDNTARSGVIFYMDGFGPRSALFTMAQRLADSGHIVLLPDLFYRAGSYGPFTGASFGDEAARARIMQMLDDTSLAMTRDDTASFLDVLASEGAERIGAVGYCMGGARALTAAASYPDRIRAAASFHGGNLASDHADSPHLVARKIKARLYVGVAEIDASFPPLQSARLAEALRVAGVDYIIENYAGMAHGWTVPDHPVFNPAGAERHWQRLSTLFAETLTG